MSENIPGIGCLRNIIRCTQKVLRLNTLARTPRSETVSARCSCHVPFRHFKNILILVFCDSFGQEDPGPDENCRFSVIAIIIVALIGIAFAILMCVFCVRVSEEFPIR